MREVLFEEEMAENFLEVIIQMQESQQITESVNNKKSGPRNSIVTCREAKTEKILKATEGKKKKKALPLKSDSLLLTSQQLVEARKQ